MVVNRNEEGACNQQQNEEETERSSRRRMSRSDKSKSVSFSANVCESETISRADMSTEEIVNCYYQKMDLYAMSCKFDNQLMMMTPIGYKKKKKNKFFLFRVWNRRGGGSHRGCQDSDPEPVGDRKRIVEAVLREQENDGSDELSIAETYRRWSGVSAAEALRRGREHAQNTKTLARQHTI